MNGAWMKHPRGTVRHLMSVDGRWATQHSDLDLVTWNSECSRGQFVALRADPSPILPYDQASDLRPCADCIKYLYRRIAYLTRLLDDT